MRICFSAQRVAALGVGGTMIVRHVFLAVIRALLGVKVAGPLSAEPVCVDDRREEVNLRLDRPYDTFHMTYIV